MKIIVGLGNPGLRYRSTRHNVGFMVLRSLAKKHGVNMRKKGFRGVYGIGRISQQEVMLFEPHTYMNLSGEAVKSACSSKLKNKHELLVISDDFHLSLGDLRLREKGSSGGHNGLQSIIDKMGPVFTRLRVGVGSSGPDEDIVSYVLSSFRRAEKAALVKAVEKAVKCAEMWLAKGSKEAMNRHN
jgi:PTH1 family peptidyl-tRNA hydrolase